MILIALSAAVGQAFGRFSYGVLLPAVRDDLGISNTLAGLIGGANVGAYLLGTLLVAWATSHYRLINVMRAGLVLATLGLLLASLSSSPWLLAMALFVAGIGGALLWIPAPVIAADALPPSQRRIAVSVMSSGIGLGIMFVSILSGSLRSSQGDGAWSEVYQIQFIIGLVLLALVLLIVRHQQPTPSGGAGAGTGGRQPINSAPKRAPAGRRLDHGRGRRSGQDPPAIRRRSRRSRRPRGLRFGAHRSARRWPWPSPPAAA